MESQMLSTREPLEWHFKQLDHAVGLSFRCNLMIKFKIIIYHPIFLANFHFALVGHLLKGFRHPTPTTVSRTSRVLIMLLAIVAKPTKRDKFEVTPESVAYLAGDLSAQNFLIRKTLALLSIKIKVQLKMINICDIIKYTPAERKIV